MSRAAGALRRHRAVAAGALAALLGVAGGMLDRGPSPPPDRAAGLVPAGALAYVQVSTDRDRARDGDLLRTLRSFDAFRRVERRAATALSERAGAFDFERDVRSWLGDEAALALIDSGEAAADTLILLAVDRMATAQGVLTRVAGAQPAVRHRGVVVRRFGGAAAAFTGGFLAVGQERVVRAAIDLAAGAGKPLAADPAYARAVAAAPAERSLAAWAPAVGLRRVLAAQDGVLGALGAALDGDRLEAVHLTVAVTGEGLRLFVRRLGAGRGATEFEPELLGTVPEDAIAYVGLRGVAALGALLPRSAARRVLAPLRRALRAGNLGPARLLGPLEGEVALSVGPASPVPVVTLTAQTSDPAATRQALGVLRGAVAALASGSDDAGLVPTFEERAIGGGITAYGVTLAQGGELLYAVTGGRLIVSTGEAGIRRAAGEGASLRDSERFRATVDRVPDRVEALAFIDLGQLLALGDAAGLSTGGALRAARDDLLRIRTIGAVARRQETDTTAELHLQIP